MEKIQSENAIEHPKFRIGNSLEIGNEITSLMISQLLLIRKYAAILPEDTGTSVHEIRRCYKKCRTLLRLVRKPLGYVTYCQDNQIMRGAHRLLADARDADVFLGFLTELPLRYPELSDAGWFNGLLQRSGLQRDNEFKALIQNNVAQDLLESTARSIENVTSYTFKSNGFELIRDGLLRIYRQGRKTAKVAFRKNAEPGALHLFRRKAKYLQYQLTCLRPVFPGLIKAKVKLLQLLTDTLGEYNDLCNACFRLPELGKDLMKDPDQFHQLLGIMEKDMKQKKHDAELLAANLYAEKPGHFIHGMKTYWKTYEKRRRNMKEDAIDATTASAERISGPTADTTQII